MNISRGLDWGHTLYCEICDYDQFSSYTDFHIHHLIHIRQPKVTLVKLNPSLCAKLKKNSYKLNTGVARRSKHFQHVPPLKISLIKQPGETLFQVINKKESKSINCTSDFESCLAISKSKKSEESSTILGRNKSTSEVEGKDLLERFGAKISISRKGGKPSSQLLSGNEKKDNEGDQPSGVDEKKENLLERLSGIGGISISTKSKSSSNGNSDSKSCGISISTKQKSIDLNQLIKLKEQDSENDTTTFDKNKILEKLSGSGLISVAPKSHCKVETFKEEKEEQEKSSNEKSPKPEQSYERLGSGVTITACSKSKLEPVKENSKSIKEQCQVNASEEGSKKLVNESGSENSEQKKFVRVKNSTFCKKSNRPEKQMSQDESTEERTTTPEGSREKDTESAESGIDILERLTDNLNNVVGNDKSGTSLYVSSEVESRRNSGSEAVEEPLLSNDTNNEERNPEMSEPENKDPVTTEYEKSSCANSQEEQECAVLLTPPSSSGQEGESSEFGSHQPETFAEPSNVSEENNEIPEDPVPFTSLSNEDQSQEAEDQQSSFWSEIRSSSDGVDQPHQDSLMTPDNPVPNGENINQNFLHNFLSEPQTNGLPPENSEFMSLDRLAQTQHQQPPFSINNGEGNTPMEQLSQQVQRIPNPTPQINVIAQHHMQAPQPPQLHTGVPLSPQHISPQQQNSYDALAHMQPPMPHLLYQGFNTFNQNFPQQLQSPQQPPRPPLLQQRPHIQPRSFQSLAAPPRFRSRVIKRNSLRMPAPEMGPPKQRRLESPLQTRPQMQNPTAKLPSGITVTPPRKSLEANKVANVLASRGITVTPAASRQQPQSKPQQRNSSPAHSPTLNISSAISITSSSQNKGSGGFAIPGPRRNAPIVNHNVERPERCTTVDLTQDDDLPQLPRMRGAMCRYPCNQCGKIFSSSITLENHKASHRAAAALPFKCDKCTAQYTTSAHLQQHKLTSHKTKQSTPDLAIPIVDLNHPGAREQLQKCGVFNFIPLAQLQSNNNGYFGVPIIQLDTAKEKAVSNLSTLGAGNILVLGKMKALAPQLNY